MRKRILFLFGLAIILRTAAGAELWTTHKGGEISAVPATNGKEYPQAVSDWKSRFIGQVEITGKNDLIGRLGMIAMTEDEWIIATDPLDSNIKLFDSSGRFIKSWGRKGQGPGEFQNIGVPDYRNPFLTIPDPGRGGVHIFERKNKEDFERIAQPANIPVTSPLRRVMNYQGQMIVDEVARDKNEEAYHLYLKNLTSPQSSLVMPWAIRYGMKPGSDYMQKHLAHAAQLGLGMSYFDLVGDDVFYVWEGELRIIRINLKSRTWSFFGKETANFVRPRLIGARSRRPADDKFSRIWGIFADKEKVLLFYANPNPDFKRLKVFFQVYDLDGTFLGELPFADSAEMVDVIRYAYHRESGSILVPETVIDETGTKIRYYIKKYQIFR